MMKIEFEYYEVDEAERPILLFDKDRQVVAMCYEGSIYRCEILGD